MTNGSDKLISDVIKVEIPKEDAVQAQKTNDSGNQKTARTRRMENI